MYFARQFKHLESLGKGRLLCRDTKMYGVKTGRLNEQVKRNIERFPEDFMFQLTKGELEILRSQIVISKMLSFGQLTMFCCKCIEKK